ncbi:Bgt-3946 [Blumeria graminis f. sp. tritici]|uniref:Bgt-3946 n=2 Tax=Blumeria graminis f. sp. tritici TaxID=62690 RepID=A0A9X9QGK8_BLUGR|nr:Phospholipid-binding protein [Blumeria graminis f. sp. tritici 96224]VDB95329.1 Bgt-3946 [Blumeria graminis f. sp. tritici]
MTESHDPLSPSLLLPIPGSPSYSYASTDLPSSYNLPPPPQACQYPMLKMSDLEASQNAYNVLLQSAKTYRISLAELGLSASTFGSALEACARLKEARNEAPEESSQENLARGWHTETTNSGKRRTCTADPLLAASGLHQLIANHQQILSEIIYKNFEVPLLHEFDQWQRRMEEEEIEYQREVKAMTKEIRDMEKEGLKLHKTRRREVGHIRQHLVALTQKIDILTGLSGGHGRAMVRDCQDMSRAIVECSAGIVRAEVDIFNTLARKSWHGCGLDELLNNGRDLFADEDGMTRANQGDQISSTSPLFASVSPTNENFEQNQEPQPPKSNHLNCRYQSLAGTSGEEDDKSIFSENDKNLGILNRPRIANFLLPILGGMECTNDATAGCKEKTMALKVQNHEVQENDNKVLDEEGTTSKLEPAQTQKVENCNIIESYYTDGDIIASPWREENGGDDESKVFD